MYHIGGDLGKVTALFQPVILKTFSKIWETEYELCDVSWGLNNLIFPNVANFFSESQDWQDLIFYVMSKFISTPQAPAVNLSAPSLIAENHVKQLNETNLW